jgi:hypothetical protein
MTGADRESYVRQFEQAKRRLPRGHVINHCVWRDGQLTVASGKPPRLTHEPEFQPRVRRGLAHEDLFTRP